MTGNGGDATRTKLNRVLPGMYVDKIVFGLPEEAGNYRAPHTACINIAMSAQRRGWSEADFINEVARDTSRLWLQLRTQRDGALKSSASAYRVLHKAWDTATAYLHDVGVRTAYDISQDARERALEWTDRLTDQADGLSDVQSAVMSYVVAETHRRGMLRVTCPGREVVEFTKVAHRTAARTLKTLARKGFLIKHHPGRAVRRRRERLPSMSWPTLVTCGRQRHVFDDSLESRCADQSRWHLGKPDTDGTHEPGGIPMRQILAALAAWCAVSPLT